MEIRNSTVADVPAMLAIINDAAEVYRGVIPSDLWHEPYMPQEELISEIAQGVQFRVLEDDGAVLGVMGTQDKGAVLLVRHAYVASGAQRMGIGGKLLGDIEASADKPILIGTWAAAAWAIAFYQRNGFSVVSERQKEKLLRTYWSIPERQVETSVVLANQRWLADERSRGVEP